MSLLRWLSLAVVALFAAAALAAPLGAVFSGAGSASLFDPTVLAVVRASVWQAGLSAALSGVLGGALGLWVGSLAQSSDERAATRASRALRLWALPYAVPTIVAATTWVDWLGAHGVAARLGVGGGWLYSMRAVIAAHVMLNAPWVAVWLGRARAGVPAREIEAAQSLGARGLRVFGVCVWPRTRWAFFSSLVQVFGLCNMSFAIVLLLGGGPPVETLETAIYSKLRYAGLDFSGATSFALWELVLTLLPWALIVFREAGREAGHAADAAPASLVTSRFVKGARFQSILAFAVGVGFVLPYAKILDLNLAEAFRARTEVFPVLLSSLGISLTLALSVTAIALFVSLAGIVAVAGFARLGKFLQILLSVPAGISTLVLALGVWLAYGRWMDPFSGGIGAIVLVQAAVFVPLAFRNLVPLLASIRKSDLEAAATLGASPVRAFFLLEWPRWRGPIACAAAVVAGAALSELAAVSLFYNERLVPLPLLVSRWMAQYRFAEAQFASALLLVLALALVLGVARFGDPLERLHR
jgi:thiamine transport system permease protein